MFKALSTRENNENVREQKNQKYIHTCTYIKTQQEKQQKWQRHVFALQRTNITTTTEKRQQTTTRWTPTEQRRVVRVSLAGWEEGAIACNVGVEAKARGSRHHNNSDNNNNRTMAKMKLPKKKREAKRGEKKERQSKTKMAGGLQYFESFGCS